MATNELKRKAKKCQTKEQLELAKTKKAIKENNMDVARVYAENSIRHRNEALAHHQLLAQIEDLISRLKQTNTASNLSSDTLTTIRDIKSIQNNIPAVVVAPNLTDALMKQLTEEVEIDRIIGAPIGTSTIASANQDDLTKRLNSLRRHQP